MRNLLVALVLAAAVLATGCGRSRTDSGSDSRASGPPTYSSFDPPSPGENYFPPTASILIRRTLRRYWNYTREISGRSVVRAENPPEGKFTFDNQTPMKTVEALQALDMVLASHHIAAVFLGAQYVKMVPEAQACQEAGPVVDLPPDQLPDSSSYLVYIVKVRKGSGPRTIDALAPLSKLPKGVIYVPAGNRPSGKATFPQQVLDKIGPKEDVLILRDYSSNVKSMLKVLKSLGE